MPEAATAAVPAIFPGMLAAHEFSGQGNLSHFVHRPICLSAAPEMPIHRHMLLRTNPDLEQREVYPAALPGVVTAGRVIHPTHGTEPPASHSGGYLRRNQPSNNLEALRDLENRGAGDYILGGADRATKFGRYPWLFAGICLKKAGLKWQANGHLARAAPRASNWVVMPIVPELRIHRSILAYLGLLAHARKRGRGSFIITPGRSRICKVPKRTPGKSGYACQQVPQSQYDVPQAGRYHNTEPHRTGPVGGPRKRARSRRRVVIRPALAPSLAHIVAHLCSYPPA